MIIPVWLRYHEQEIDPEGIWHTMADVVVGFAYNGEWLITDVFVQATMSSPPDRWEVEHHGEYVESCLFIGDTLVASARSFSPFPPTDLFYDPEDPVLN